MKNIPRNAIRWERMNKWAYPTKHKVSRDTDPKVLLKDLYTDSTGIPGVALIEWQGEQWWLTVRNWGSHGGECLAIFHPERYEGIALLEKDRGDYASSQRPPMLRWDEDDYRKLLNENKSRIAAPDCCGYFPAVWI